MNRDQLEDILREIVERHARTSPPSVLSEHSLTGDLGFDSLAFLLTVSDIEERFDVEIPLEEFRDLPGMTFGRFVETIARHLDST